MSSFAPISASRTVSSPAVSSSPISVSARRAMSPVSMPASVNIVVTPAFFSPSAMHQLIGALPRYFGSSDACTLTVPMGGMSSIRWLRICPNAAVTHRSGLSASIASRPSRRRTFSNWNTGMPCFSAKTFTGQAVSLFPRPLGRSGCVNAPTTSYPLSMSACREGTANSGVPINTIRMLLSPPQFASASLSSSSPIR